MVARITTTSTRATLLTATMLGTTVTPTIRITVDTTCTRVIPLTKGTGVMAGMAIM